MRHTSRITVETTSGAKDALDALLLNSGLSLPEWLELQIAEGVIPSQGALFQREAAPRFEVDLDDVQGIEGTLRKIEWAFDKAATDYLSHDIHPYPAKFIPQIPRYLISILSRRGELVWDPFGGSGTTALEATLLSRRCLSTDVNPLAEIIGQAKTLTLTVEEDRELGDFLDELRFLASNEVQLTEVLIGSEGRWQPLIPEVPNLESWFHPRATEELAYIRWRISALEQRSSRILGLAALSRAVLRSSFQDSETRYVSKKREVPRTEVLRIYVTYLGAALKKVRSLGPLLHFRKPTFHTWDLRLALSNRSPVHPASIDLVVTSPPYPNATDYHLYHRFRLFWLGFDPRLLANDEIGSHLRHQKQGHGFEHYIKEMTTCLLNVFQSLRPGRFAVMVLGDAVFKGTLYKTADEVATAASEIGFQHVATIDRALHSTKRSFVSAARRLRTEQLLILRKPARALSLRIERPAYKLWDYEEVLQQREVAAIASARPRGLNGGAIGVTVNAVNANALRRLTFSHQFSGSDFAPEMTWQAMLENGDQSHGGRVSKRKDPKYATHGIHEYKGKFYPQLAKSLFNLAGARTGTTVLDPFCGSGTVLLEGCLNGLVGTGIDINPMAVKIARAKVNVIAIAPDKRDRLLARFESRLDKMSDDPSHITIFPKESMAELRAWFPPKVLAKFGWLLSEIEQVGDQGIQQLLLVLTSSLVREVSHQEPKDLRIRRRKEPIEDAPVAHLLSDRVQQVRKRLRRLAEVANWAPDAWFAPRVVSGDIKSVATFDSNDIRKDSIDLIVTSPPYATALPYIDTDRLSILLLLGLTSSARQSIESDLIGSREIRTSRRSEIDQLIETESWGEISSRTARDTIAEVHERNRKADVGFRRKNTAALLYLYFSDMAQGLHNLRRVLRPGGNAFFVIGDNRTTAGNKELTIRSAKALQELGQKAGWKLHDVIPITVTKEDRLHNRNSITENDIIWFKAPTRATPSSAK